jgi:hypothetical protein
LAFGLCSVALSAPAPTARAQGALSWARPLPSLSRALARFAPYTQKMADKIFKALAAINLVFKGFHASF